MSVLDELLVAVGLREPSPAERARLLPDGCWPRPAEEERAQGHRRLFDRVATDDPVLRIPPSDPLAGKLVRMLNGWALEYPDRFLHHDPDAFGPIWLDGLPAREAAELEGLEGRCVRAAGDLHHRRLCVSHLETWVPSR